MDQSKGKTDYKSRNFRVVTEPPKQGKTENFHAALHMSHVKQIILILSGKGGVGKSTVTALLAANLQQRGMKIGILDADITGPSIPRLFGVTGPLQASPMGIFPVVSSTGIKIMSSNLMLPQEDMALIWRGPVMSSAIKQFREDVLWGDLDVLLVDLPPGTSDATLTVMQSYPVTGAVMVSMPQMLSSMVVRKTVNMAEKLNIPVLGVIENMSWMKMPDGSKTQIFGESHIDSIAELAKAPVLGRLEIDPSLTQLEDNGKVETYQNELIDALADAFLKVLPPEKEETEKEQSGNADSPAN